jgi:L-iditol 2-dehydrogenase
MRALMLFGPSDLRLEEVPEPEPRVGEIVVAIAAAVTCATDAKMMRRGAHPALGPLPAPFGHEAAGVVSLVGAGVTTFREGDRVAVANSAPCDLCPPCRRGRPGLCEDPLYLTGAYAERLRVPARIVGRNLLSVAAATPWAHAAMVEPIACAVRAVERSRAAPGDTALVIGAGLQGVVIAGLLRRRGLEVIVCDPHEDRRTRALVFGAAQVADAPRDEVGRGEVREMTARGAGADIVFACAASVGAWEAAVALAAPGAEVNLHAGLDPDAMFRPSVSDLHYREITLQASYHHSPAALREAMGLIESEALPIELLLGSAIGLEDVAAALRDGGEKHPVTP